MDLWRRGIAKDGTPTGTPERLTTGVEMLYASFSPYGRRLVYSKGRSVADIWQIPILAGRPATWSDARQLTDARSWPQHVSLSPDKQQLVFCLRGQDGEHMWKMPSAGGEPEQLTSDPALDSYSFWSPDGKWVLFTSRREGGRVWRVPAEGGEVEPVLESDDSLIWSQGGDRVYFGDWREGPGNLYEKEFGGSAKRQLTDFAERPGYLDDLADTDGEYLYFTWSEDFGDLWVMDVDESR